MTSAAADTELGSPLESLPRALRDEPGLTVAFGDPIARLAVGEVARPISVAALSALNQERSY